jgi:hypothetical protein
MTFEDSPDSAADVDDNMDLSTLLPEGKNQLWARIWYDEGFSIDSTNEVVVEAKNFITEPWQFTDLSKAGFPLAVRNDANSASFAGEGYGYIYQPIAGDFMITARVADMTMKTKANGMWFRNWIGLSILRKHENPRVLIQHPSKLRSASFLLPVDT